MKSRQLEVRLLPNNGVLNIDEARLLHIDCTLDFKQTGTLCHSAHCGLWFMLAQPGDSHVSVLQTLTFLAIFLKLGGNKFLHTAAY